MHKTRESIDRQQKELTNIIDISKVENLEIDGVDTKDYPDFCDTFFSHGEINGRELTEDELDQLGESYPDVLNQMALEYYI